MTLSQWYELRIEGGAGTRAGIAAGIKVGIAIGEDGRLCPVDAGRVMKFKSASDAEYYLNTSTNPGAYKLEIVLCGNTGAARPLPSTRAAR